VGWSASFAPSSAGAGGWNAPATSAASTRSTSARVRGSSATSRPRGPQVAAPTRAPSAPARASLLEQRGKQRRIELERAPQLGHVHHLAVRVAGEPALDRRAHPPRRLLDALGVHPASGRAERARATGRREPGEQRCRLGGLALDRVREIGDGVQLHPRARQHRLEQLAGRI
jgi:hypothetical protein